MIPIEQAQGMDAFDAGLTLADNPYDHADEERKHLSERRR